MVESRRWPRSQSPLSGDPPVMGLAAQTFPGFVPRPWGPSGTRAGWTFLEPWGAKEAVKFRGSARSRQSDWGWFVPSRS